MYSYSVELYFSPRKIVFGSRVQTKCFCQLEHSISQKHLEGYKTVSASQKFAGKVFVADPQTSKFTFLSTWHFPTLQCYDISHLINGETDTANDESPNSCKREEAVLPLPEE